VFEAEIHGIDVRSDGSYRVPCLVDGADLLIVGSRGYGPLGSVFHGSVSSYLERHAQSGLLVVPRRHPPTEPADSPDRAGTLVSRA
jgi:nucleotide-binding universal stress UspA family protein